MPRTTTTSARYSGTRSRDTTRRILARSGCRCSSRSAAARPALLAEDFVDALDPPHGGVDVVAGRVDVDTRARRRRHVHAAHGRLRAVMAGAHAHAVLVQNRRDVVGVDSLERETDHAAAATGALRSEEGD